MYITDLVGCVGRDHIIMEPPISSTSYFLRLIVSAGSPKLRLLIHDAVFFIYQIPPAKGGLIFPHLPTKVLIFFYCRINITDIADGMESKKATQKNLESLEEIRF